ncbi:thiamine pyrophosphate-dependent enzyme [Actinopolymorpha sp. B17G11]|uniref:thiamine pyrophosphate-dependent enzyme n=1 Tax=unclassified Actinopolymorpha TaxID=2627063 RepID=UPI0032D98295
MSEDPTLTDATRVELFRLMILVRAFDDAVRREFEAAAARDQDHDDHPAGDVDRDGDRAKALGLAFVGREPVAAAVAAQLRPRDAVTAVTRPHQLAVARGLDLHRLAEESVGLAHRHGSTHGVGAERPQSGGIASIAPPAGGSAQDAWAAEDLRWTSPLMLSEGYLSALGRAFAFRERRSGQIAASIVDRAVADEEGFRSAMTLANLWKLPVVFVVEDDYGTTPPMAASSGSTEMDSLTPLTTYDIPGERVEHNAVEAIYTATGRAVTRARSGEGPSLVEVGTVRVRQEDASRVTGYLPDEYDVVAQDPLPTYETSLRQQGTVEDERLAQIRTEAVYRVSQAIRMVAENQRPEDCPLCARKVAS